jgi:hypothetical protein
MKWKGGKKMRFLILFLCCLLLIAQLIAQDVYGVDTSTSTSKGTRTGKEKSITTKKTIEQRSATGKRKSHSTSTGLDKQTSEIIRSLEDLRQNRDLDVSVQMEGLFLDMLRELEQTNEKFSRCKVISNPILPSDIGFVTDHTGVVDVVKASWFSQMAQNNAPLEQVVSQEDKQRFLQYRDCLALYGAIIGKAFVNLLSTVKEFESGDRLDLGYDDLLVLAKDAMQKAIAIPLPWEHITQNNRCRIDGTTERISCGPVTVILKAPPQMWVGSVQWYGERFGGYAGTYRVSAGWSWQKALEHLRNTTRYARWAEEVSKYSEELSARGKARDAVLVKRKAWEIAKNGSNVVSPSLLR